ncbi:MAG: cation:proton antiporter [Ferruginibacter sp.]
MAHLPNLIIDLALILIAAAIVTFIFKRIRQPLVLGYIIAGFLVGPYFKWLPSINEVDNIRIWAEIGVIFLLFSLGLEFSFKKLVKVGGSASITAVVEIIVMVLIGYGIGRMLGWSGMDSLFLGGILSISSTTIIIRAFDELGYKTKKFATLVFGVLIVEDLVAIVLMVLLSTLAVSDQFAGKEIIYLILKLVILLFTWFLLGIFFIPTLLKKVKSFINDEMLLIFSIAMCLLMVILAYEAGFSPALGAFVMGSILAETTKAEKIEHLITPVKDLFGAIFFVSVGMLIDPSVLVTYALPVAIICIATIVGKVFSTTLGALVSGQPLQVSIQAGFSLAQIGEFSFIIATLGLTLNVTSDFLYPVAVAVSAVTTLTTPYLIRSSGSFYQWLNRKLPEKFIARLQHYSSQTKNISHTSEWKKIIRHILVQTLSLSLVIVSLTILSAHYVYPWITRNGDSFTLKVLTCFFTLLILAPVLWALAIKGPPDNVMQMYAKLESRGLFMFLRAIQLGIAAFLVGFLLHRFFNLWTGIAGTTIIILLLVIFSKKIQGFYTRLESRFFTNLNQREINTAQKNRTELAPWNAHIVPIEVSSNAAFAGKSLQQLQWRELIGVNVVLIKRGDIHISVPAKDQVIYPGDELLVLGTDHQLQRLKVLMRSMNDDNRMENEDVELYEHRVNKDSVLNGKTIRQSGIRENARAIVVGVESNNERILNPESGFILAEDDLLFIVGNKKRLNNFFKTKM